MTERLPELSAIVSTPDDYSAIRKLMRHLRAQTARSRMELLIVAPAGAGLRVPHEDLDGFADVQLLEATGRPWRAHAAAAAVRRARAPVVALTEDHCFPEPEWADAMIAAHRGPWAAVGACVQNANQGTWIALACHTIDYGQWTSVPGGEVADVPGFNSSYKRELLLEYGERLEPMMERLGLLHADLRARGHRLYVEAAARTHHWNPSSAVAAVRLNFQAGRLFASDRARTGGWSAARRLAYVASAPLFPALRWPALRHHLARFAGPAGRSPMLAGPLVLMLAAIAAGEAAGYASGEGGALQDIGRHEYRRDRFLAPRDRAVFLS